MLEFIEGGDIADLLFEKQRLSEDVILFYAAQLILGIGHLHSKKIVHRDLKTENVLIGKDGYLKIIDYGVARKMEPDEDAMTYGGTEDYMAPEMINQ